MSEKNLQQFLEFSKLADTDPEVAKRITEASKSPQELIAYGKETGFTFDMRDMEEVAKKLIEQEEELSDDELEAAAGGYVGKALLSIASMISVGNANIPVTVGWDIAKID